MEKCVRVYFISRNKTRLTIIMYNAHSLHNLIALGSWIHCLLPFKLFSGSTWLFYFSHYPAIDGRKVRLYSCPLEIRDLPPSSSLLSFQELARDGACLVETGRQDGLDEPVHQGSRSVLCRNGPTGHH